MTGSNMVTKYCSIQGPVKPFLNGNKCFDFLILIFKRVLNDHSNWSNCDEIDWCEFFLTFALHIIFQEMIRWAEMLQPHQAGFVRVMFIS